MIPFHPNERWYQLYWVDDAARAVPPRVRLFAGMLRGVAAAIAMARLGIPRA